MCLGLECFSFASTPLITTMTLESETDLLYILSWETDGSMIFVVSVADVNSEMDEALRRE